MRLNSGNIYLTLMILILFTGCTKELPFDTQDVDPKLVVSGFLKADAPIEVVVSHSLGLLEDSAGYKLDDANVKVIYNSTLVNNLVHVGNGRYRSSWLGQEGGNYKVEVSHPLYPDITGRDSIPVKPVIAFVDSIALENGSHTVYLELQDPPGPSYFTVRAIGHNKLLIRDSATLVVIDSIAQTKLLTIVSLEKIFDSDKDLTTNRLPFSTFTDQFFSDRKMDMSIRLIPSEMLGSLYQTRVDSVSIELRNVSSAYYKFIRSYNHAKPVFGGPFGSFNPIIGNINGGYGIIAGYNAVETKLPVNWR